MTDKPGKHPGDYTDSKQDDKFRWQSNWQPGWPSRDDVIWQPRWHARWQTVDRPDDNHNDQPDANARPRVSRLSSEMTPSQFELLFLLKTSFIPRLIRNYRWCSITMCKFSYFFTLYVQYVMMSVHDAHYIPFL
jgi:hypothetical protein